ncbi:LacI family transcriptional regulator [Paenibacillus baekrokdamisoli]|uniref:LacI family transcriptional regulator n=1 Tax=Paenibacillus baekrokdamisoli TaxID=1712516 RepID=A0A3G9IYL2_9BACL|nr:LacI family DNA-binding transcriptional regulator [Paenibacillus baekrokdamisoli]MBB3068789.1 LacI family transcriptional regulator [Paenibacillus baekrokdamisoli]BBH23616.1 LacI family transcriptional regulator [Paenibacillus baekrokdamisoli]
MANIKDIAKQAGVSISTVSYALNGSPKVTDETSARILAIAKELHYIPNAAARNLKKQETKIIGVFLTDFSGSFYGHLLQGMKEGVNQSGYDLVVCSGKQSHQLLPQRMIDGAIVLDETFSSEELLRYADLGHKLVVMDRDLNHPNINQVLLDNKAGATLAVEHLIELGHRKLYVVTGPKGSFDSRQRLQAVKQVIDRHPDLQYIEIEGDFNKSSGALAGIQIAQGYSEPAAVFCLNDEMAIGMYDYLITTDIRIGEDIHIIGFDNIEVTQYTQPRLASIDYSKQKWGLLASEQLLKLIAGNDVEHEHIYVTLVKGKSMGAV